ncbi:MAG: hypothetical protein Q8O98_00725 [bacterium]|nr:hypothetical protein [bacterium]
MKSDERGNALRLISVVWNEAVASNKTFAETIFLIAKEEKFRFYEDLVMWLEAKDITAEEWLAIRFAAMRAQPSGWEKAVKRAVEKICELGINPPA